MADKKVSVSRDVLDMIRKDADRRKPEEACGLLVGRRESDTDKVEEAIPMANVSRSAVQFSIDPAEMYQVLQEAEAKGLTIVGSYHSHPTGSVPSCLDAEHMKHTSYVWLIVPERGRARAYTFEDGIKEMRMEEV